MGDCPTYKAIITIPPMIRPAHDGEVWKRENEHSIVVFGMRLDGSDPRTLRDDVAVYGNIQALRAGNTTRDARRLLAFNVCSARHAAISKGEMHRLVFVECHALILPDSPTRGE